MVKRCSYCAVGQYRLCNRKTRVGLISTGYELRSPGEALSWGDVYNSNGPGLSSMLQRMNVEVIDYGVLSDDSDVFRSSFLKADAECDFVIASGGVSVGEADYTKEVLELGYRAIQCLPY